MYYKCTECDKPTDKGIRAARARDLTPDAMELVFIPRCEDHVYCTVSRNLVEDIHNGIYIIKEYHGQA